MSKLDQSQKRTDVKSLGAKALGIGGLTLLVAAVLWMGTTGIDAPPRVVAQPLDPMNDGWLQTTRATPAAATALSDTFVPVSSEIRAQVLQRLTEFQAKWKVQGPVVTLNPYDVNGDAVALAEQFEGWLDKFNLIMADKRLGSGGDAGDIVARDLPAPNAKGMLLRFNEDDTAVAEDLVMAMAPALGGGVTLRSDSRVRDSRIVVSIVGAPKFADNGVAFFPEY